MSTCSRAMGHLRNTKAVSKIASVVVRGVAVAIWWKRLRMRGDLLDREAAQFIMSYGDGASEAARRAARTARNKRDLRQARHYSHVALRISELTKPKIVLDAATQGAEQAPSGMPPVQTV